MSRTALSLALLISMALAPAADARGTGYTLLDFKAEQAFEAVRPLTVLSNQSVLVGAQVGSGDDQRMGVIKLDKRGKPVRKFGRNGLASATTGDGWMEDLGAMLVKPDGSIVLTRTSVVGGTEASLGIVHFSASGKTITKKRHRLEGAKVLPNYVMPRADGGVIAGGMGFVGSINHECTMGLTASLDLASDYDSSCLLPPHTTSAYAIDAVAQPDGSAVLGLAATQLNPGGDGGEPGPAFLAYGVMKLQPDGKPDESFGDGGFTFTRFATEFEDDCDQVLPDARRMAPRPGGGWVVGGQMSGCDVGLIAYTADGRLDTTFGSNGIAQNDVDLGRGPELMTGLIATGGGFTALVQRSTTGTDPYIARWRADGSFAGKTRVNMRKLTGYKGRFGGGLAERRGGGLFLTTEVSFNRDYLAVVALTKSGKVDKSFGVGYALIKK